MGFIQSAESTKRKDWGPPWRKEFYLQAEFVPKTETLTPARISSLLLCPANFRLASPHNCMNKFLKINISLPSMCLCILFMYMCVYIHMGGEILFYGIGIHTHTHKCTSHLCILYIHTYYIHTFVCVCVCISYWCCFSEESWLIHYPLYFSSQTLLLSSLRISIQVFSIPFIYITFWTYKIQLQSWF